jgi:hypothetical protein
MSGIQMALLGVGPGFTAAFNNAETINISEYGGSGFVYQATYTINTDGTCTKFVGPLGSTTTGGPTAWGTPTGGVPGNNYEVRLNVTEVTGIPSGGAIQFAGVDVTSTGFTSWYALSSNRAINVVSDTFSNTYIYGTLYIRNTSTLVEISRTFGVQADSTY